MNKRPTPGHDPELNSMIGQQFRVPNRPHTLSNLPSLASSGGALSQPHTHGVDMPMVRGANQLVRHMEQMHRLRADVGAHIHNSSLRSMHQQGHRDFERGR